MPALKWFGASEAANCCKNRPVHDYLGLQVFLGAVLLISAILKMHQLFSGSASFVPHSIRSKIFVAILIEVQILLSIWLFVGGFTRIRLITVALCFGIFALVSAYDAIRGMPTCGCFGNVEVPPLVTSAFDLVAVVALFATQFRRPRIKSDSLSRCRVIVGLGFALSSSAAFWICYIVAVGRAAASPYEGDDRGSIVLYPESWLNKPFPLFNEIDGGGQIRNGRWLIVLYHYDCKSCLEAIPIYSFWAANAVSASGEMHLAFIAIPPYAPQGHDPVSASFAYLRLSLRPDNDWNATTPVVAAIEDGRVLAVRDGVNAIEPPDVSW
jgi:hypothetical protein